MSDSKDRVFYKLEHVFLIKSTSRGLFFSLKTPPDPKFVFVSTIRALKNKRHNNSDARGRQLKIVERFSLNHKMGIMLASAHFTT